MTWYSKSTQHLINFMYLLQVSGEIKSLPILGHQLNITLSWVDDDVQWQYPPKWTLFRKITEVIKNSNGSKFSIGWNPAQRRYYFENGRYVKMLTPSQLQMLTFHIHSSWGCCQLLMTKYSMMSPPLCATMPCPCCSNWLLIIPEVTFRLSWPPPWPYCFCHVLWIPDSHVADSSYPLKLQIQITAGFCSWMCQLWT